MNSPELQESLREWLSELPWDCFLTLNLNTSSTRSTVRTHFKHFCQYLDRSILGRRYMSNPARRTLIIVFLEHADTTNPHLHGLVQFRDGKSLGLVDRDRKVLSAWERAVKSGTIDMQEVYEPAGVARYITKECWSEKNYDSMMISSEFFGGEAAQRNSFLNRPLSFLDRDALRRRADKQYRSREAAATSGRANGTTRASHDRSPDDRGERHREDRAPRAIYVSFPRRRGTEWDRRKDDYGRE